jgi:hypothetical protein
MLLVAAAPALLSVILSQHDAVELSAAILVPFIVAPALDEAASPRDGGSGLSDVRGPSLCEF